MPGGRADFSHLMLAPGRAVGTRSRTTVRQPSPLRVGPTRPRLIDAAGSPSVPLGAAGDRNAPTPPSQRRATRSRGRVRGAEVHFRRGTAGERPSYGVVRKWGFSSRFALTMG